jgi:alpha-amylase/alpha-mannosidase (GH57 family)
MWHMHQPYYKDPLTGKYALPWMYLHAVKDYFDMAAIIDEVPGMRAVFNFVPSLLEQLLEYASGQAKDPFLIRGRMAPADMSEEDRIFVIRNFFSANRQRMIEPNRRYLQLLYLAGDGDGTRMADRLANFGDQEILDLQVWFFLAWTGEAARRRFPEFRELVRKGWNYSEADKEILFSTQARLIREIIPFYRRLHDEGKAELSVSPYHHPILPLLCDVKSALVAMPRASLPAAKFRHPGDARGQILRGISLFEEIFGFTPSGMWPSEGAVSDEALGLIAESGLQWAAGDQEVLARSTGEPGRDVKSPYRPYSFRHGGKEISLFFRDHTLSDRIGFTYSQWDHVRAVEDFMGMLKAIRKKREPAAARTVSIILDGENAWEYYRHNGYDFLKLLYEKIVSSPDIEPVTFSQALEKIPERETLTHVHPGSWINASYGIWIGHPEENLAWDFLEKAREAAVRNCPEVDEILSAGAETKTAEGPAAKAERSIQAAEGSDWFWWFGDDHFSPHSGHFDRLFRNNLINVYRSLGLEVPLELFEPIKKETPAGLVREPVAMITPAINGMVDDYFEWLPAGLYDLSRQSAAMHPAESLMHRFYYGFNRRAFYLRFDGESPLDKVMRRGDIINLHIIAGREYFLPISADAENGPLFLRENGNWKKTGSLCRWKIARICEVQVPFDEINPEKGSKIFVYFTLVRGNEEIGRWPTDALMILKYLGPDLELENWLV